MDLHGTYYGIILVAIVACKFRSGEKFFLLRVDWRKTFFC